MVNSFVRDTIVIIGRSEIVREVANLSTISELFITLAINNTNPSIHPTYTMFVDKNMNVVKNIVDNKIDTTVLTTLDNINSVPLSVKSIAFRIKPVGFNCTEPYTNTDLHYCGFTHDLAISFAIQQGFKRVILLGAADFTETHYDNDTKFKYSNNLKRQSINFIENVCTQHCEIYAMNPSSVLNVQRITGREILGYASQRER